MECFAAAVEGELTLESTASCATLAGGVVSGTVRYSVIPGYENTRGRVLCQFNPPNTPGKQDDRRSR